MEMCPKLDALVLPRARRRFWPTCAMQSHLDGIGVKVFGISNVNGERLRHIAIQSNRHRLFAQGKRKRTGCFAGLRRLIWFHVDCDVSARRCGLDLLDTGEKWRRCSVASHPTKSADTKAHFAPVRHSRSVIQK
jgi:hypothetical protein